MTQEQSGWSGEGLRGTDTSAVSMVEGMVVVRVPGLGPTHPAEGPEARPCLSLASERCFPHLSRMIGL